MKQELIKRKITCRACKGNNLEEVFSFGPTPLANAFLKKDELDFPEAFYPLDVYFCTDCYMVQLGHVISPDILFSDYVYVSSTSSVFVDHFKQFAADIISRFSLDKTTLVIDIGSNDGILLKHFKKEGIRVLGIEPAKHIAKIAQKDGVNTIPKFFSLALAKKISAKYGKAKIVTATNVFAHIDNLDEVIEGIKELLTTDGLFIMEAPYLIEFIEKKYFDLVYHEHLSYWAIRPLVALFNRFNMSIFDVQRVSSHGGSIRVFVKQESSAYKTEKRVDEFIKEEEKKQLDSIETYKKYANDILENKMKLIDLITKLKLENKRIVGFGAPAKGNTLLNYFKIGTEIIDYIIEDSAHKQDLYTPGTRISVVAPSILDEDFPDYILILAWNFAKPIIERYEWFRKKGGKFIIPVPTPTVI